MLNYSIRRPQQKNDKGVEWDKPRLVEIEVSSDPVTPAEAAEFALAILGAVQGEYEIIP